MNGLRRFGRDVLVALARRELERRDAALPFPGACEGTYSVPCGVAATYDPVAARPSWLTGAKHALGVALAVGSVAAFLVALVLATTGWVSLPIGG